MNHQNSVMNPFRKEGLVLRQANEGAGWDGFKFSHYIWALCLKIILNNDYREFSLICGVWRHEFL